MNLKKLIATAAVSATILAIPSCTMLPRGYEQPGTDQFTAGLLQEYGFTSLTKVQDAEPLASIPQIWHGKAGICEVTITVVYESGSPRMRFVGSEQLIDEHTLAYLPTCSE